MTINHINLTVEDVHHATKFFEDNFDFECEEMKGENMIAVLRNKENFTLVLMSSKMNKNGNSSYPDAFHIGFMLESAEEVDQLHQKLKDSKIEVGESPRKIRDSYGFYFYFDNIFIEVGQYLK